jgi:nucleotide-binding universal stress UspA family protein
MAWGYDLRATASVVAAPREKVAWAIVRQASAWPADMIVMTRRPSPAICRLLLGSISDKVMRMASCPVLAVHPRPTVARNAGR